MHKGLVIGLDLGTTSVKACIFSLSGQLISESERLIRSYYPHPNWVEQDPDEIERSAIFAIKEAITKGNIDQNQILSLGISSAMHSLICVDQNGKPLSSALIWADGRGYVQAEQVANTNGEWIYAKTGTPIHPMTPFIKLLWMKDTHYDSYQNAKYFMSIKEYVLQQWFGERIIDYSMASATGLFNPITLDWDDEVLQLAGINRAQLSKIVPPTELLIGMNQNIADEIGIRSDMPFAVGAADGQLANLGIGAILPGEVAVSAGTSGAIRQLAKSYKRNETRETFCYSFTEDYLLIGGPTNNGGIALQWLKELVNHQGSYEEFLDEATGASPGSEGLIFLPYINGERAPVWNQRAKGNFYGVSITHKRQHFIRAVLEGITFNLYQIGKALEKIAGEPTKIYVNGGLSRSELWLQIMADVFATDIYVSESHNSSAWGAAWVSLVAIGKVNSFEEIKANIPMGKPIVPIRENCEIYKKMYQQYENLAKDLIRYF